MADKSNVNEVNNTLTKFVQQLSKAVSVSSQIEGISESIKQQYGQIAQKNAVVGLMFSKMTSTASGKSKEMAEIQQLLTKALLQQNNAMSRREKMMGVSLDIQTKIQKAASNPLTNRPDVLNPLQKQLDATNLKIKNLDKGTAKLGQQISFLRDVAGPAATAIQKLGDTSKTIGAGAFLTGFGQLLVFSNDLNRAVIQTNANLGERHTLLKANLDVQLATGASSKTLLEINREMASIGVKILDTQVDSAEQAQKLASGGFMTAKAYKETLATANMLVEGLGASVKEAVQLQITARASNMGYRELGNTISKITAATGLAADEASRYARQLLIASKIAVGNNAKFDDKVYKQNLVALSGIEGAMKDSIGVQGEISEMLVKFSSFKKSGGMGIAFGTGGIDFLQKGSDRATKVIENIAKSVQGMSGPMLEAYADMTGLSPQTLVALGEKFKEAQQKGMSFAKFFAERQELMAKDSDLQERYNKQLALQGETFSRLGKVIVVLAGSALEPLLRGLNWLSIKLMGLFKMLGPEGPLGPVAGWLKVGFGVIATGFLVTKLWDTTRALFAFTASLVRLSTQLKIASVENTLTGLVGGGVKGTVTKTVAQGAAGVGVEKLSQGFFSRIFSKTVATGAAEGLAATASKGILSRLLGGLASFFGGTLLRTIGGTLLRVMLGLVGGVPGLIIGLVVTILPLLWPKIKSWFGGGTSKTVGAGIDLGRDKLQDQAIKGFTRGMMSNNGRDLAISQKAYEALIKAQGRTPEELEELNKNIVSALNQKIDVQFGAFQRDRGVDKTKDVERLEALNQQVKVLESLSTQLSELSRNYKVSETAKEKAKKEREEEDRRQRLIDSTSNSLSLMN